MFVSGMLVSLPDGSGVGKLDSVEGEQGVVSIFHSIVRSEIVRLPLTALGRAFLSPQTRVYALLDDRYKIGRVVGYRGRNDAGLIQYEIKFPNGNFADLYEPELCLRPWRTPDDPSEVLANGGAESQFLHDRRQAALRPLLKLRSAAQGLTSLLSAGIDLAPHQISAVRRVLSDPVQRYLLADEVGLGKTIEAGLVVRQHLIDDPAKTVLVTAPRHLVHQWRQELDTKLRLGQFSTSVAICSHEDLATVECAPEVLVVDEAHHLVGVTEGPLMASTRRLRRLAKNSPVLLLLSATPPLGNEFRFLSLLNLLEPDSHSLDDLAAFRAKLESRREIGRLLLALDPEANGFVLRQRGAELLRLFPEDSFVNDIAPRLIAATREERTALPELCQALKTHVADTYRINQRLIRSRRVDAEGWEFTPRGPAIEGDTLSFLHLKVETVPDGWVASLLPILEEWRFAALEVVFKNPASLDPIAARYAEILSAVGIGPETLTSWIDGAVASSAFEDEERILLSLSSLADDASDADCLSVMVESTRRLVRSLRENLSHPKVVVFSTSESKAIQFCNILGLRNEGVEVLTIAGGTPEGNAKVVAAFSAPKFAAILVCDREGEEGLNLSSADAIVHLDIPFSAERVEQRIGRLDRFGRTHGMVKHRILSPWESTDSPWTDWLQFLSEGLSIFHRSISDVQFLLESIEREVLQAILHAQSGRLNELIASVRDRLQQERRLQDEQYALDRIALAEEPVETYLKAINSAEEDEAALETGVDKWLVETLRLEKRPLNNSERNAFKLRGNGDTLIPKFPWLQAFGIEKDRPLTWKRRIATRHSEMTLLRPGTPLIDFSERFTRWDDRGTAFVTWRTAPEWQGELWLGFRLCFVIEPNLQTTDLLAPDSSELARARRAQRYFPLRSHTLHVDTNGDRVKNPELLAILRRSYKRAGHYGEHGSDVNLSSRPQILANVIDPSSFAVVCGSVRNLVSRRLFAEETLAVAIARGVKLLQADIDRRRNRLVRRQMLGDPAAEQDLQELEFLLPAIQTPALRLDAMGCFVVSNCAPTQVPDA